ncbi:MAG TPA: hypothetical protein DEP45_03040 [Armatimonadetes bacterium]|nr:hypothetical protein [Armatimonadota bacterium]
MYMVWVVLDQVELLGAVQEAWEEAGIHGATMVESSGFSRLKSGGEYVPTRYVVPDVSAVGNTLNNTIFSIMSTEQQVHDALRATEKITGDLDQPNTGVFAAWPLLMVKGVASRAAEEGPQ